MNKMQLVVLLGIIALIAIHFVVIGEIKSRNSPIVDADGNVIGMGYLFRKAPISISQPITVNTMPSWRKMSSTVSELQLN